MTRKWLSHVRTRSKSVIGRGKLSISISTCTMDVCPYSMLQNVRKTRRWRRKTRRWRMKSRRWRMKSGWSRAGSGTKDNVRRERILHRITRKDRGECHAQHQTWKRTRQLGSAGSECLYGTKRQFVPKAPDFGANYIIGAVETSFSRCCAEHRIQAWHCRKSAAGAFSLYLLRDQLARG